jgi:membrane carboxypeptidase/penicillin-binding protein PbpC
VKTGTTTDFRDNWTVGYTPEVVVGVWVGNTDNAPMEDISGVSGAGPIWHHFMRTVLRGKPESTFNRPDDLIHLEVCALSGMLPTEHCPYTIWEWFIPGTAPTDYDTLYRQIDVDLLTGLPADGDTPPERIRSITFLDLPAFALEWAQREGLSVLPGEWVKSDQPEGDAFLRIVSPDFNAIYQIDPATPLQAQKLRLVAVGSTGLTDVTLRMDGKVVATFDAPPYETWWLLETGTHTLYAEATLPDGTTLTSDEVTFTVNPPAAP